MAYNQRSWGQAWVNNWLHDSIYPQDSNKNSLSKSEIIFESDERGPEGQVTWSNSNINNNDSSRSSRNYCIPGPGPNTSHILSCWTVTRSQGRGRGVGAWMTETMIIVILRMKDVSLSLPYSYCLSGWNSDWKTCPPAPQDLNQQAHSLWATADWRSSGPKGPLRTVWRS